ncbi:cytoplasmic protein [Actinoplanes sp. NPDC051633]|uniref:cytoplasmic protein n=1 Tax=Actinoplanes sp. NPDC051633 TaxID=3155670 RepID=UPI00343AC80E
MNDPVLTNPELYSVVFENARVRVLRYHDRPGDRTRPHHHPDSVMITMSSFQRQLIHGEQSVNVALPAGEIRWLDAQEHSGQNIGGTDTMTLFVELKEPAQAPTRAGQLGPRT